MIYLAACAAAFGLSLLNVLMLQRLSLWRLSVATTEFGHWLAAPAALLVGYGFFHLSERPWDGAGICLAGAALFLFLTPLRLARREASLLPAEMERAFGPLSEAARTALPSPLSIRTLLLGGKTPRGAKPVEVLFYAERESGPLRLDFYRARATAGNAVPCVVLIHGGGWNSGSPEELPEFNRFLAVRGFAVASIEYRLAPGAVWPAAREDLLDALRYLKTHAGELGIDPERLVLFGRSAGGQIAMATACVANDPAIRGCVALYAPSDMHFSFRYAKPGDILDSPRLLIDYLGGTPETVAARYDDASARAVEATPPMLLLHGRHDPLVWFLQSERWAARLRAAGRPHAFVDLPWATHAFDYDRRTPGGQLAAYAVSYFLAATTGR